MNNKRLLSGLLAAAMVLSFAACGSSETSSSTSTDSGSETATEQRTDLIIATENETPSLNPYDHNAVAGGYMNLMTHNGLFRVGEDLNAVPDLCESYEALSDTEWQFNLRQGVKFHDGTEMTAEDVKASLEYAKTYIVVDQFTKSYDTVEVIDDYTVKITTPEPSASLLDDLASHANVIVPKALIDSGNDFNKNPIGTGAYKFVEWTLGDKVVFEKFDDYFNDERAASIETVTWRIIPEGASRTIALEAGEVDMVIEVESMDVERLRAEEGIDILEVASLSHNFMLINNEVEPFDNELVRKAINAAIDKESLVIAALNGQGVTANGQLPMGLPGFSDVNTEGYDVELAKAYLAEWGGDPSSIVLPIICSNDTKRRCGEIIQACLLEIGINATIESMDLATYLSVTETGDFTSALGGFTVSNMLTYLNGIWHSSSIGASNMSRYSNPEIDALIDQANVTLDATERAAIITEICEKLNAACPHVPTYQPTMIRAYNADLEGVALTPSGTLHVSMISWAE